MAPTAPSAPLPSALVALTLACESGVLVHGLLWLLMPPADEPA
jgi:hypothetical protein